MCSLKTFQEEKCTNVLVCLHRQFTGLMVLCQTPCGHQKYSDVFALQGRLLGRKFLQLMIEKHLSHFLII